VEPDEAEEASELATVGAAGDSPENGGGEISASMVQNCWYFFQEL